MVRIRGLVRVFNRVRDRLQAGIPESEVDDFKAFVRHNVAQVERICSRSGATPSDLPGPSRSAYFFLKQLDLDDLPISEGPPEFPRRIKIANIVRNMNSYSETMSRIAAKPAGDEREREKNMLRRNLQRSVKNIEDICARAGASPQGLNSPSRKAYSLMKFLVTDNNLDLHINTLERITDTLRNVCAHPSSSANERDIIVELSNFEGIFLHRRYKDAIFLRVNEGFVDADDEVIEAVVANALMDRSSRGRKIVDDYIHSEEYQSVMMDLEMACGIDHVGPVGLCYDLRDVFATVNGEYFRGEMEQPSLTWNRTVTVRKFGHYVPSKDLAMVSMTLDDPKVRCFVVEFVMYHELLHKKHGIKWQSGRRLGHTPALRREEKTFQKYHEAEAELKKISRAYRWGRT